MFTRTVLFSILSVLSTSVTAELQSIYGQCGGINWSGATECVSSATCVSQNPYYYQCTYAEDSITTTTAPANGTVTTKVHVTSTVSTSNGTHVRDPGSEFIHTHSRASKTAGAGDHERNTTTLVGTHSKYTRESETAASFDGGASPFVYSSAQSLNIASPASSPETPLTTADISGFDTTTIASTTTDSTTTDSTTAAPVVVDDASITSNAATTSAAAGSLAGEWDQCGGTAWTGATECVAGNTCLQLNEAYYQCSPTGVATMNEVTGTAASAYAITTDSVGTQYTGRGTYWSPSDGNACGLDYTDGDLVVAVGINMYEALGVDAENRSNVCGKKITATYNGNSVDVTVLDACGSCLDVDLDFSPDAFEKLAPLQDGIITVEWEFTD